MYSAHTVAVSMHALQAKSRVLGLIRYVPPNDTSPTCKLLWIKLSTICIIHTFKFEIIGYYFENGN